MEAETSADPYRNFKAIWGIKQVAVGQAGLSTQPVYLVR